MVLLLRYADPSVSGFVGIVAIAKLCLCALHNLIRIILLITPVSICHLSSEGHSL